MKLRDETRRFRESLRVQYLQRSRGILHLGAHLGQEAHGYAKFAKPVLWIEALPGIHAELAERLRAYPNQRSLCALLAGADGEQHTFFISNNSRGVSSSLFKFGAFAVGNQSLWPDLGLNMVESIVLRTSKLDTLFQDNHIEARNYDYWVVDLQGAEKLALSGATESLCACRSLYIEASTVEVYQDGVLWAELRDWLYTAGFVALWEPELPHDDVLLVRRSELARVRAEFQSEHYLDHNHQRLEHLASLDLDLANKTVLEVGAGIGDHTDFYLDRGCSVTVTDVRPENVAILGERFGGRGDVDVRPLDLACPKDLGRSFDVIHCYGIVYHLEDPASALEFLARHCTGMMLVETCVSFGDARELNPLEEPAMQSSQAFYGKGCRPTRSWIWTKLKELMPYVYIPRTQPRHDEFPLDWSDARNEVKLLKRAVFVASRKILDNNARLSSELLTKQTLCLVP